MRDKERIDIILGLLKYYWEDRPDMRFCQLVSCLTYDDPDIFYVEDEVFLENLKKAIDRDKVVVPM